MSETVNCGENPGEVCNRDGCQGVLVEGEYIGEGCRCKIDNECEYCQQNPIKCPDCGYSY